MKKGFMFLLMLFLISFIGCDNITEKVSLEKIEISGNEQMQLLENQTLIVKGMYSDFTEKELEVKWLSSDESILKIDELGKATVEKSGIVTVSAIYGDYFIDTLEIEVLPGIVKTLNTIIVNSKNIYNITEGFATFTADLKYSDNTIDESGIVNWTSSDDSILIINNDGEAKFLKEGIVKITVEKDGVKTERDIIIIKDIFIEELEIVGNNIIELGKTSTYKVNAIYSNGEKVEVVGDWSINNNNITINNGFAKGIFLGESKLSVEYKGLSKFIIIEVKDFLPIVKSLKINYDKTSVEEGKSIEFTVVVTYGDNTSSSAVNVEWSSSEASILKSNGNGKYTAVKKGTADVIVKKDNFTKQLKITVTEEKIELLDIEIVGESIIEKGKTSTYKVNAIYSNGTKEEVVATWSVNNDYITIADGIVKGILEGQTILKAEYEGISKSITIKVKDTLPEIKSLKINYDETLVEVGKMIDLTAEIIYDDNTTSSAVDVDWTSSDSKILKSNGNGKYIGVKKGTAEVIVSKGNISKELTITVTEEEITITKIEIIAEMQNVSEETTLTAKLFYSDGTSKIEINVDWFSSDESVATISSNGLLKPLADGEVIITVKKENFEDEVEITVDVEVELVIDEIIISDSITELEIGETLTLKAEVKYTNRTSTEEVDWESDDTSVITIDNKGNLTAKSKGNANIYAVKDGVKSDAKEFTVKEKEEEKGIKIYIEEGYGDKLYAWAMDESKLLGGWPGKASDIKDNGFYVYEFDSKYETINYIILKNTEDKVTEDQKTSKTIWRAKDGKTYDSNPNGVSKPDLKVTPAGATFTDETKDVKIEITYDDRSTPVTAKYSFDNENVKTSGTDFTSGKELTISGLAMEESTTLYIYVSATDNEEGTLMEESKEYIFSRKEKPEPVVGEFTWDNAYIYFVMTDRFYNGDTLNDESYGRVKMDATRKNIGTFHGGDIKGMTNKLEDGYFKDLGVNAIWVTAPYEQTHGWVGGGDNGDFAHYAYHGYYALDYTTIDKNIGTTEEFRTFVNTAHSQGIRVVLDVVLNHLGYETLKDMEEFGYGSFLNGLSADWTPSNGQTWHSHHDIGLKESKKDSSAWSTWWGRDWIRASGISGYNFTTTNADENAFECNLESLPDLRSEITGDVGLPPILKTKWPRDEEAWILEAAKPHRKNLNISPADYLVTWLADWVREFGIDGFRCDTAKHIELKRWQQLKDESNKALKEWRNSSRSDNDEAKTWDEDFWMTGEVWGHGANRSEYHDNGFDSIINFNFQDSAENVASKWGEYANKINNGADWNTLSYVSSHDSYLHRGNMIKTGTNLVLQPGGVQVFYGDETSRPFGETGSDEYQGTRSDMNWGENGDVLAHWKKLGKFRFNNPAVGAGRQIDLAQDTFGRIWEENGITNKVVIKINSNGSTDVSVGDIFNDGDFVRNAYNGETGVVSGGTVTFTGENEVILIEASK